MEKSEAKSNTSDLLRTLSVWTKQLTLEWPLDWIVPGDLARAADNSGWRSPTDRAVMMLGLIAEMYVREIAINDLEGSKPLPTSVDFRNICQEMLVDFSSSSEDDWNFAIPSTGTVVLLQSTELGLAVSDQVDPDIDLVTYEDRERWISSYVPAEVPETRDLRQPGAMARAVLRVAGPGPLGPETFFAAAEKLGYDDPRDQAVAGFGALSQMVTTGLIVPADDSAQCSDNWDMASAFTDMAHSWFAYAGDLKSYTGSVVSRPAPPDLLKRQTFRLSR